MKAFRFQQFYDNLVLQNQIGKSTGRSIIHITPEERQRKAILVFREIRLQQDAEAKEVQSLEEFTGPDMTEYMLVMPPRPTKRVIANLKEELSACERKKGAESPEYKRLELRCKAYEAEWFALNKEKKPLSADKQKIVDANRKLEIEERRQRIKEYIDKEYGKDSDKAKTEFQSLCNTMDGYFDIAYVRRHNRRLRASYEQPLQEDTLKNLHLARPYASSTIQEELIMPTEPSESAIEDLQDSMKFFGTEHEKWAVWDLRCKAYQAELNAKREKRMLTPEEAKLVEANRKAEIAEKEIEIGRYVEDNYGPEGCISGVYGKEEEAFDAMCKAMKANFDVAYTKRLNERLDFQHEKERRHPKDESLSAMEAYRKKRLREANIKEENYQDGGIKEENQEDILEVLAASEKKHGLNEFLRSQGIEFSLTTSSAMDEWTLMDTSPYQIRCNAGHSNIKGYAASDYETSIPGFSCAGSTMHHEYMHHTTNVMAKYIKTMNIPGMEGLGDFSYFCDSLMAQDLDLEIRKIIGHTPKDEGRQKVGFEHHGITSYATTLPGERLAEVYAGLASKAPKDWTIAERALSNILKGGWERYAQKIAEFLKTPIGRDYLAKYRDFKKAFGFPIKRFSPDLIQKLNPKEKDWTEGLTGNNQSLLRNSIVRMIAKWQNLDIIKPKLQKLKDAAALLVELQKRPEYSELVKAEQDYLGQDKQFKGHKPSYMHGAVKKHEYYALENLFSKIKKYVKETAPEKRSVETLLAYIKKKQSGQTEEVQEIEKRWLEMKTKFSTTATNHTCKVGTNKNHTMK